MKEKNLDVVLETPGTVKKLDGTEIHLRPLPIMEGLEFIDSAISFKANILGDLIKSPEQREKVLSVVEMLLANSDYPADQDWKKDKNIGVQTLQDVVDAGFDLNLPQSKTPTDK